MIRNIVLDWGGIIVDLDGPRCCGEFHRIGAHRVAQYVEEHWVQDMFLRLELGEIDEAEFCRQAREQDPDFNGSDRELVDAWNALLAGIPAHRIARLLELKKRARLFLLSNTNDIHWRCASGWWQPEQYFEKVFLSYEMGLAKPSAEMFQTVLREGEMKPEETLFIDDSKVNCEAAEALGIHTIHTKSLDYADNIPW